MIQFNADYAQLLEKFVLYARAKVIVEIGVAAGFTTALLCRGAQATRGHVYGFDIWQVHGVWNQFGQFSSMQQVQQSLARYFNNFTLTQIDSKTPQFPPLLAKMCPKINFAFIDGCHSYDGIKNDFDAVYPLMDRAGIVVFHDTLRIDGCREFVLDLRTKLNDGTFDVIDLPWGINEKGRPDGLSILVKRDFQNHEGIDEICSSPSQPAEIYRREREWYQSQLRKPST